VNTQCANRKEKYLPYNSQLVLVRSLSVFANETTLQQERSHECSNTVALGKTNEQTGRPSAQT
jgi:hypothetical protein